MKKQLNKKEFKKANGGIEMGDLIIHALTYKNKLATSREAAEEYLNGLNFSDQKNLILECLRQIFK